MTALGAELADRENQFARDRAIMVTRHLEARGIFDPYTLAAMGEVPREAFIAEPLQEFAYGTWWRRTTNVRFVPLAAVTSYRSACRMIALIAAIVVRRDHLPPAQCTLQCRS